MAFCFGQSATVTRRGTKPENLSLRSIAYPRMLSERYRAALIRRRRFDPGSSYCLVSQVSANGLEDTGAVALRAVEDTAPGEKIVDPRRRCGRRVAHVPQVSECPWTKTIQNPLVSCCGLASPL